MVAYTYNPSYMGSINRGTETQAGPGIKPDPISKITKSKSIRP
jgi:hypothetical protein